jgi:heat shock protein HslJ
MRNGLTAALLLCGAMCLAGFDRPAEPGDASILDHTKWRLTKVTKTELAIPAAAKFTVTFESSQYMFSGCNLISGKFRLEAGKLIATGPGRSTMKACPPEIQEVDGAFVKMLTSKPTVHLEGDQLALAADDGGQWTFHREPIPSKQAQTKFIYVAASTKDCTRAALKECLQVRESKDQPWTVSHADIEGFEHVPGIEYRLRIKEDQVPHRAADAPSVVWYLDVVVEQTVVDRKAADEYEASKKQ